MTFWILLALNIAIITFVALVFKAQLKSYKNIAKSSNESKQMADERFLQLREELNSLQGRHSNKHKQLEELREVSKKRLRKEARKEKPGELNSMTQINSNQDLDLAVKTVQEQTELKYQDNLAAMKAKYEEKLEKLKVQLNQRNERVAKSKKKVANESNLDPEGLSEEVLLELGRLNRRSENAEKLNASTRGKLQMAQERYSEMQKRYFGVCRELALASSQNLDESLSDEEVRNKAEDVLAAS